MKQKTVEKILNRYIKGLIALENEALNQNCQEDAQHYKLDRTALEYALAAVQKGKE